MAREGTLRHPQLLRDLIRRLHRVEELGEGARRLLLLCAENLVLFLQLVHRDLELARFLAQVADLLAQRFGILTQAVAVAVGLLGLMVGGEEPWQQSEELAALLDPAGHALADLRRHGIFHAVHPLSSPQPGGGPLRDAISRLDDGAAMSVTALNLAPTLHC